MKSRFTILMVILPGIGWIYPSYLTAQIDPYETYIKTSKDFQSVRQEKDWFLQAWPCWTYMPWSYRWGIGYDDAAGKWSLAHGYNGAFLDRGQTQVGDVDKLAWIDRYKLRFYMDHTASKRYLHLWDGNEMEPYRDRVHGTGVRIQPVNEQMRQTLQDFMRRYINKVKTSPNRAAYALDDEISWGHFVHPCMWQVTDDFSAYTTWLAEIYGPQSAPRRTDWISYEVIWPKLKNWRIQDFDCSPLMDQWTFNDSTWNNFLGDLVGYSNQIDPATPCGIVGGQSPNAFGGYDYAKLMRKIQFLEAYNIGGSQSIIRSFNPHNAMPTVTTHFHKSVPDTIWQVWYYLAHGNRGFIGWVDGWFDGKTPKPWHDEVASHYLEAGRTIGPLLSGAEWIHDGVALYYNHASIQLGWILDAEAHRSTWINRNGDHRLGSAHLVRHAWENMLRDEGVQYNFINYADVIQNGIPGEYRVLILPAALCLSDAEARRIREFCRNGGTVIADYMPGLWDQHGRGRTTGGVLDDLFGLKHRPTLRAGEVFQSQLWVEVDQDVNFNWKRYREFLTRKNDSLKDSTGFNRAVRTMDVNHVNKFGRGKAVLMNLSPQWYNAYRESGYQEARKREAFLNHVTTAGSQRWIWLEADPEIIHGYDITYWKQNDRTILFVCYNPEIIGSSSGGGNAAGLKSNRVPIRIGVKGVIQNVRDERTGERLPDGNHIDLSWKMNEALVLSFEGKPPR